VNEWALPHGGGEELRKNKQTEKWLEGINDYNSIRIVLNHYGSHMKQLGLDHTPLVLESQRLTD
jgi:hypothetical protein